jgi:hypothetical protein
MRRIAVLIASAAINASTVPVAAAECMSIKDLDVSRARWATVLGRPAEADKDKACRAWATSFYESVTLRQEAARCAAGERNLALLDSEINAFNDLISAKCGG